MKNPNEVKLLVNGIEYGGWKSVRIEAGIDRQARSFDLEVTDKWPGKTDIASRIKQGDVAEVYIGDDLVLTGYVDATPIRYDAKTYSVGVKGRSKTADLVDCCPATKIPDAHADVIGPNQKPPANTKDANTQFRARKLEKIAEELAKPYGIKVITQVDTGAKIKELSIHPGETVFEVIDGMMRKNHVLSSDNEKGELVFVLTASGGRCTTAIELGKNVLSGASPLDYKDVFSEYVCHGQMAATGDAEDTDAETVSGGTASVTSDLIKRRRVLVLTQSGQADSGTCKERVLYEKAHREGKALETFYEVSGWREADGKLWQPNKLVRVRDALIGFDIDMLIVGLAWVIDDKGQRTELKVGPPDGYRTKAEKKAQPNWSDVH